MLYDVSFTAGCRGCLLHHSSILSRALPTSQTSRPMALSQYVLSVVLQAPVSYQASATVCSGFGSRIRATVFLCEQWFTAVRVNVTVNGV